MLVPRLAAPGNCPTTSRGWSRGLRPTGTVPPRTVRLPLLPHADLPPDPLQPARPGSAAVTREDLTSMFGSPWTRRRRRWECVARSSRRSAVGRAKRQPAGRRRGQQIGTGSARTARAAGGLRRYCSCGGRGREQSGAVLNPDANEACDLCSLTQNGARKELIGHQRSTTTRSRSNSLRTPPAQQQHRCPCSSTAQCVVSKAVPGSCTRTQFIATPLTRASPRCRTGGTASPSPAGCRRAGRRSPPTERRHASR